MTAATRTARQVGPIERAARCLDIEGEKRRVLLALAAFADEGRTDPTVTELSRRCRVHRMAVVVKLDKLARDGVIAIQRGDHRRRERTTYRFLIDTHPTRKDPPMTKTKAAPTVPDLYRHHDPHWQREGWLPGETQLIEWPELTQLRSRHADIVAALREAREADDSAAIHAALLEVADFVPEAIATLRRTLPDAEAWFAEVRAEMVPAGKTSTRAEQQAQGEQVRAIRPKVEADVKALRRAARIIEADMFDGESASTAEPTALIEARRLKEAIA
ncbi:MAG TPA: hypothetical protein VJU14_10870 [Solirubrobacterales bacterium]|nr:hypothetical protein [Solirubrobacterales bacterium]